MIDKRDKELVSAFHELRAADAKSVSPFVPPSAEHRPGRPRLGLPAIGLAAVAAALCLFFVFRPDTPGSIQPAPDAIAFDQLSDVISRELFVASASEWDSPTAFLLHPDLKSPTELIP